MKLEHPLLNLFTRCETVCVPACCGIDAYDFSPIHIASFLTMYSGSLEVSELEKLTKQLKDFREKYGASSNNSQEVNISDLSESLTPKEVDLLIDEIERNIIVAKELISQSEDKRWDVEPENGE